jgi:hypothetical protein
MSPRQCHRQHKSVALSLAWLSIYIASWSSHLPSPWWLSSTVASMTHHLHHVVDKSPRQCHCQHDSAAPSPTWLGIYKAPSLSWHGSIVTNMTQHLHRIVAKSPRQRCCHYDSVALSPAWLVIYIASMTRQHHHRYASTSTSHHGEVTSEVPSPTWLGSTVVGMSRHLHHATIKWPQQCRRSMTRQHCRQYDSTSTSRRGQVASAVPSPPWLSNTITSMTRHLHTAIASMTQKHHRQHDSTSTKHYCQHDSATPSLAWLSSDIMWQLERQHQQHMTLAVRRQAASSYWYCSPIYLVRGPMQAFHYTAWHLHDESTIQRFTFEDSRLPS